jgi:fido (protein-threonine AMPylation protein)
MKLNNPCYDDKGVPYNLLDIHNARELKRYEYVMTHTRGEELREKPIPGNYDLEHLQKIHQYLFHDIYGWAGKTRTINFYKLDETEQEWKTVFAPAHGSPEIARAAQTDIRDLLTSGQAGVSKKLATGIHACRSKQTGAGFASPSKLLRSKPRPSSRGSNLRAASKGGVSNRS